MAQTVEEIQDDAEIFADRIMADLEADLQTLLTQALDTSTIEPEIPNPSLSLINIDGGLSQTRQPSTFLIWKVSISPPARLRQR